MRVGQGGRRNDRAARQEGIRRPGNRRIARQRGRGCNPASEDRIGAHPDFQFCASRAELPDVAKHKAGNPVGSLGGRLELSTVWTESWLVRPAVSRRPTGNESPASRSMEFYCLIVERFIDLIAAIIECDRAACVEIIGPALNRGYRSGRC